MPQASINFFFNREDLRSTSAQNSRFVKDQLPGDNDPSCPNNFLDVYTLKVTRWKLLSN